MAKRRTFRKKILRRKRGRKNGKRSRTKSFRVMVRRLAETKSVELYSPLATLGCYGGALFAGNNVFPVTPYVGFNAIVQGITQGNRIGNRIEVTDCHFKGCLTPYPYDVNFNPNPRPCMVKMWFVYDKLAPAALPIVGATWFQLGGVAAAMTNNLPDMFNLVNTDSWRVLGTKTFKLGLAGYDDIGQNINMQNYQNNDFKLSCFFNVNVTKMMRRTLVYNDNAGSPTTRGVFVVIQCVNADGSAPSNADQRFGRISFTNNVKFKDM